MFGDCLGIVWGWNECTYEQTHERTSAAQPARPPPARAAPVRSFVCSFVRSIQLPSNPQTVLKQSQSIPQTVPKQFQHPNNPKHFPNSSQRQVILRQKAFNSGIRSDGSHRRPYMHLRIAKKYSRARPDKWKEQETALI